MRYGYSLPERLSFFKDLIENPKQNSESKWDVPIGGILRQIEVYKVPVDLPKYRLDNTRTLFLQEQYTYDNTLDEDFFSDLESDKVQEIQHNLLKKLITNPDKDKDLLVYFAKAEQTEPLIMTSDGFVISGNRRLCTYRELFEDNPSKYKKYSLVRVVILPKLTAEQVDQIEDYFEQQKDIKEPFSWVSIALGYRKRIQKYGYSDEKLASITGVKKAEIRSLIDRLEIADRYLESINKAKDYNLVLDDRHAFEKIYTCQLKEKGAPSKKAAFEKIAFIAIKNKESFSDRMYKNIPIIHEVQSKIHEELKEVFEPELAEIEKQIGENPALKTLGLKPDATLSIIKLLEQSENEEKIIDIVSDKIEEHLALEREKKKKSSVLERVIKANTLLIEANTIKNHETDKEGVISQLSNIEKEIEKLMKWANTK